MKITIEIEPEEFVRMFNQEQFQDTVIKATENTYKQMFNDLSRFGTSGFIPFSFSKDE